MDDPEIFFLVILDIALNIMLLSHAYLMFSFHI